MAVDIVIYHNPACGTSRNTLAMIRNAGIEPHVVEYLKTPPARAYQECQERGDEQKGDDHGRALKPLGCLSLVQILTR